jgi:Na+-translocating ferredoxin:NAD+ oxidoreductase subunit E
MNETHALRDNAVGHQLLCLLPLLVVTNSVADAVAIGMATFTVLVLSNLTISALRGFVPAAAPLPAHMLLIGLCTTSVMMLMQVYAFDAHQRVALLFQIVLCNCIVLAQAERVARKIKIGASLIHSVVTGAGFFAVLLLVGVIREGAPVDLPPALLPVCVFFAAALLLAAKNARVQRV